MCFNLNKISQLHVLFNLSEKKNTLRKISNSEENSKRKLSNQMAKSKAQTHQTNG